MRYQQPLKLSSSFGQVHLALPNEDCQKGHYWFSMWSKLKEEKRLKRHIKVAAFLLDREANIAYPLT